MDTGEEIGRLEGRVQQLEERLISATERRDRLSSELSFARHRLAEARREMSTQRARARLEENERRAALGTRIRARRLDHGITLAALADRVGVSRQALSSFERKGDGLSLERAERINRELDALTRARRG